MKVLALDFDGVIGYTNFEVFIVTYNTYLKFFSTKLFGGEPFTYDKVDYFRKLKEIKEFDYLKSFARNADEQVVSMYAIDKKIKIGSLAEFKLLMEKFQSQLKDFFDEFYRQRKILQKDMKKWSSLAIPYKKIVNAVNRLKNDFKIAIITNKNTGAVYPQAEHFGLFITEDDIYDVYVSKNKRDKLKTISEKFNVGFKDIIFVDDILEHLTDTMSLGIKPMLATWFNSNEGMRKEAKKLGITLLSEDNFYTVISELK